MYEIDIQSRTLYAELIDVLQIVEASRSISSLKGSFSIKDIKGDEYVYFRVYNPSGQLDEIYVGKRNDQTERLMRDHASGKSEVVEMGEKLKRLSSQIMAGAKMPTDKAMIRVIRSLADTGVFKNGGVLVGTHAFQAAGLMLGVCWSAETTRTTDVDLAVERKVAVAIPVIHADIPAALDSLQMGFYPVPRLNHKEPSTNFAIRKSQLRLDVLTPKTEETNAPIFIKRFNCAAEPLSYLSYLIESPVPSVLLDSIPVPVNIPQPVRYALHKLIVSQVRDVSADAKRPKDLYQSHQILSVLQESRPFDIQPAWQNLIERGPKWEKYAKAGLAAMEKLYGKLDLQLSE
ncbi:MAG: GSU2403 family nucleotidyltransferase fold protein [Desulfuromonadaceae bacterium]